MNPTTPIEPSQATETPELSGCPLIDARNAAAPGNSRRNVLRAMGIAALGAGGVGALAACASDDAGTTPSTGAGSSSAPASSAPASSAPASSAPASSASGSASSSSPAPSESSSAAVPDGVKVAKSEIPEGGGIVLDDADYVVTQPSAGVFKAFTKRCTHQGNPLGSVEGNNIICPFHGSKFSITDGSVTGPPATKALEEFKVVEAGSDIVIVA